MEEFKRSMNFEEDILFFLKEMLSWEEHIIENFIFDDDKSIEAIDFFLPNGCSRLHYPPRTAIEVKNRITSGSIDGALKVSRFLQSKGLINRYVLISHNIPIRVSSLNKRIDDSSFILVDFDKLRNSLGYFIYYDGYRNWQDKRELLINKARFRFSLGKNTFFLGAGVSQDAGLPGWDKLLERITDNLLKNKKISLSEAESIKNDSGSSSLIKARYLKTYLEKNQFQFVPIIRKALYANHHIPSKLLSIIAETIHNGKVLEAITYNYDDLLENYLKDTHVLYSSVDSQNRPSSLGFPILHVHGYIPQKSSDNLYDKSVVLSEDDYHSLYKDAFHWANIEQMHALLQTTCFFIGLSLKDPSLRRLMDIAHMHGSQDAEHFAFLKRDDYSDPSKAESLFISMGANIIWYEHYDELPLILDRIFKN